MAENEDRTDESKHYDLFNLLADEIVIHVLCDSSLTFLEVCRFGATCKRLLVISRDQIIWKEKLLQRFPYLLDLVAKCYVDEDWRRKCEHVSHMEWTATNFLSDLPKHEMDTDEVPNEPFLPIAALCKDEFNFAVVDKFLRDILDDDKPNSNLTEKYYAKKAIRYFTHDILKREWASYLARPNTEQYLEDGAILIARWCQAYTKLKTEDIKKQLNDVSDLVKDDIKSRHGENHPACQKYQYDGKHIPSLSVDQCKQVLDCINRVLYVQLGFHGNTQDYYNEMNSNINQVIENKFGIPITMSIVYESIARRLGVLLQPVNFPGHFIMVFDMTQFGFSQQRLYIDAFHKGKQLTASECQSLTDRPIHEGSDYFKPCTTIDVCIRMAHNLIRFLPHSDDRRVLTALELFLQIKPGDIDALIMLSRFYVQMKINLPEVLHLLGQVRANNNMLQASLLTYLIDRAQEIINTQNMCPEGVKKLREENQEVEYSFGLIMKHKRYHYDCVICGWDATCEMSEEWKKQMGVYSLPHKDTQPYYHVLVDDGSIRYAAQESLEYHTDPHPISHPDVGKHLVEFNGQYYTMNQAWQSRYPDDAQVTQLKAQELYGDR